MRLLAIGGDRRMEGAAQAALHAGWASEWRADGCLSRDDAADVVMLPWPHSFREE